MVIVEFAMFPTDKGDSVSSYVSKVIDHIDKSGTTYKLTPMGTLLEGTWDEVFSLITECFRILEPHSSRIYSVMKVDYRKGDKPRMAQKIESIQNKLGRNINHA